MIIFQILFLLLLDYILIKLKSITKFIIGIFASLYPLVFNIAYLNNWIPYGVKYPNLSIDKVVITNFAYIVLLIFLIILPEKKVKVIISKYKINSSAGIAFISTIAFIS